MIINHLYQFCFFAIPRTASKAVSSVLLDHFQSEEIMRMHTSYDEFKAQAKPLEHDYFTFTIIRNPLDSLVSAYHKMKSDHNNRFSRGTFRDGRPVAPRSLKAYRFIKEEEASFADYFLRFHQEPFRRPRHEATARKVDRCLRFENLQADFNDTLRMIGLEPFIIPVSNTTAGKHKNFISYYTHDIIPQAVAVTRDIMREWGYAYPKEWQQYLQ
jgi:hypothetical protein